MDLLVVIVGGQNRGVTFGLIISI